MRKLAFSMTLITILALSFSPNYKADDNSNSGQGKQGGTVRALLTGYQEVPAVSSNGVGQFDAQLSDDKTKINFKLQWKNLEGASITNADVRFGQFSVTGGASGTSLRSRYAHCNLWRSGFRIDRRFYPCYRYKRAIGPGNRSC